MVPFEGYLQPMRCVLTWMILAILAPSASHADEAENESSPNLWDVVEAGLSGPVSVEEELASDELRESRFAEQAYVDGDERPGEADASLYVQPTEVLSEPDPSALQIDSSAYDLPVVHNDIVQKWMDYFQGRGKVWFTRYLERKSAWEPMINATLGEAGLPKDLIHVAMIESGFSNHAHSHAAAVGMWQFIAPTGRGYGLRIDYWIDERKDPFLATQAASRFYGDLHRQFEDWALAMAAYDTGPSRVRRAMRKHGSRDYWLLVEKRSLHPETRDYVGKVFAAAILAKNPEKYGFEIKTPHEPWRFEEVNIEGSVSLSIVARCAGVDLEAVEELNPMYLRGATPPKVTSVVRVPVGTKEDFLAAFDKLPESERLSYARHTVASGEALGVIAEKYGVPMQSIVEFNRLPNANKIRVGMELVIPVPSGAEGETAPDNAPAGRRAVTIRVKSGENLSTLAQRHGVRRQDIIDWNKLSDPDSLQIGQELTLYGDSAPAPPPAPKSYTVKAGDSLYSIALAHDLTVDGLKRANGLSSNTIRPGQVLKLGSD